MLLSLTISCSKAANRARDWGLIGSSPAGIVGAVLASPMGANMRRPFQ